MNRRHLVALAFLRQESRLAHTLNTRSRVQLVNSAIALAAGARDPLTGQNLAVAADGGTIRLGMLAFVGQGEVVPSAIAPEGRSGYGDAKV